MIIRNWYFPLLFFFWSKSKRFHKRKISKKKCGLVTQSGFLDYITETFSSICFEKKLKVGEIKNLPTNVFTINSKKSAFEAFNEMKNKCVSGLPILNDFGEIIDVISVSDLTIFSEFIVSGSAVAFTNFSILKKPVTEFLKESRTQKKVSLSPSIAFQKKKNQKKNQKKNKK